MIKIIRILGVAIFLLTVSSNAWARYIIEDDAGTRKTTSTPATKTGPLSNAEKQAMINYYTTHPRVTEFVIPNTDRKVKIQPLTSTPATKTGPLSNAEKQAMIKYYTTHPGVTEFVIPNTDRKVKIQPLTSTLATKIGTRYQTTSRLQEFINTIRNLEHKENTPPKPSNADKIAIIMNSFKNKSANPTPTPKPTTTPTPTPRPTLKSDPFKGAF